MLETGAERQEERRKAHLLYSHWMQWCSLTFLRGLVNRKIYAALPSLAQISVFDATRWSPYQKVSYAHEWQGRPCCHPPERHYWRHDKYWKQELLSGSTERGLLELTLVLSMATSRVLLEYLSRGNVISLLQQWSHFWSDCVDDHWLLRLPRNLLGLVSPWPPQPVSKARPVRLVSLTGRFHGLPQDLPHLVSQARPVRLVS